MDARIRSKRRHRPLHAAAETWRRVGGRQKKFSRTKISEMMIFSGKNFHFHAQNIWWPFFSHRPGFSDFPLFTVIKCPIVYDPFYTGKITISEKNFSIRQFFTLFILSHTSDNTTSLNIGGTNAWAVPTSNLGGPSPRGPSPPQVSAPAYTKINLCTARPIIYNYFKWSTFS